MYKEAVELLLEFLQEVYEWRKKKKTYVIVEVCVDCGVVVDATDFSHFKHTAVWTDIDHNGIGEWIEALKWMLRLLESCKHLD
jgi:predicted class III extradiol MEMO1 family dioxygenase